MNVCPYLERRERGLLPGMMARMLLYERGLLPVREARMRL